MIVSHRTVIFFSVLFSLSFLLFLPGFSLYFHQDDFMHMMHARTWEQVIHSFNLFATGEFPFYRPIPTHVYFFFLGKVFGLQPLGYHLVNFGIYCFNSIVVYRLGSLLANRRKVGAIAALVYAINSTHAAPLFSAAYVHELLYVCFGLLTVIQYVLFLNKQRSIFPALIFFIVALMTKENAIVLPGIIALISVWYRFRVGTRSTVLQQTVRDLIPFAVILAVYLYGHFAFYGLAASSSYSVILGKETVTILLWYFLWALSVPNILIDFLQPGMKLIPVFFSVAEIHAYLFLIFFPLLILFLMLLVCQVIRSLRANRTVVTLLILSLLWFITAMIPLLPFPLHHLATEQAFALTGLSIGIAVLLDHALASGKWGKIVGYGFITIYLLHAANTILLAQKTHWIVRSSQQAGRIIRSLQTEPPTVTPGKTLVFLNGQIKIPEFGSSKQIYEALGNGAAIELLFGDGVGQLYEWKDEIPYKDQSMDWVILDSSQFLGY